MLGLPSPDFANTQQMLSVFVVVCFPDLTSVVKVLEHGANHTCRYIVLRQRFEGNSPFPEINTVVSSLQENVKSNGCTHFSLV